MIDIKSIQKNDIMCKSPANGVLFEWSHNMTFSGHAKMSDLEKLGVGLVNYSAVCFKF